MDAYLLVVLLFFLLYQQNLLLVSDYYFLLQLWKIVSQKELRLRPSKALSNWFMLGSASMF